MDVCIMPSFSQIEGFLKLLESLLSDDYIACFMRNGYACVWMKDICERYDIDMKNIFCE
jgi:hypothetical protein